MKFWEIHQCLTRDADTGAPVTYFVAELYEQPLWAHLRGQFTFWVWMRLPHWMTGRPHDRWIDFEVTWTYDIPHRRRRFVEQVRVVDRDVNTWWKPGGDAPLRLPTKP